MRKAISILPLLLITIGLQADVANAATSATAKGAVTEPHATRISISNFTFSPATIEVSAGTTLVWTNDDDVPHTIAGTDPKSPLKSPALDTDDRYSLTVTSPGIYKYFCSLHPHMTGTLIVK